MADRRGQQFGNYRLDRLLGRGAFAEVYLGDHIYLGTPAAVKLLTTRLSPDEVKSFLTEARTLVRLNHANIVQVLDFGLEGDTPFLVMSYAPNGTLRTRHPPGTKLTPITILPYVQQVASALQYAHNQQVIHRDVKPENILVGVYSEILLSDFGIALPAQSSSKQNTVSSDGTVAYMAPEQCEGHPCFASDQYSLGVVMYEWLTGERPFHGSSVQIAYQHIHATPVPLRDKAPELSPAFNWIVMTALQKNPQQRFPSINNLADAFTGVCLPGQADTTRRAYPMSASLPLAPAHKQWKPPAPEAATPTVSESEAPTQEASPSRGGRPFSRRLFLLIGAGAALTGAGALAGYGVYAHQQIAQKEVTQPTPTPPPPGTLIFTYSHAGIVYSVAWSPTGSRIASAGGKDWTIQVWNANSRTFITSYLDVVPPSPDDAGLDAVAWSPDGKRIAFGGSDAAAQVRSFPPGGQALTRKWEKNIEGIAWSPDGTRVAAASADMLVHIWDIRTGGEAVYQEHTASVLAVAWSPDGKRLASASANGHAHVWDAASRELIKDYTGHGIWSVNAVAWSPLNNDHIVTGSSDRTAQVWDARTGQTYQTYSKHTDVVEGVAWSPDGKRIVSASRDMTAQVWDAANSVRLLKYEGHHKPVWCVAWSPDGRMIASGGEDAMVQVWQAPTS